MIAGIDFSTHTIDVVLLEEDRDEARWFRRRIDRAGRPDAFTAARRVRDELPVRGAWRDQGVTAVGLEIPFSRSRQTIAALMRIQGAILACLPPEIPVHELAPYHWKPALGIRGQADKEAVRAAVFERGYFPDHLMPKTFPQDAFDACGLAVAARAAEEAHDRKEAA